MSQVEVRSEITGSVWKIVAAVGDHLAVDDPLVILESMKMEIPVVAPDAGQVVRIDVVAGQSILEDELVAVLEV